MADHERPPQQQSRPGSESGMEPESRSEMADYVGSGKLEGRKALITGGDSGIGRAVSIGFAKEGAEIVIAHLEDEEEDCARTIELASSAGPGASALTSTLEGEQECRRVVTEAADRLGGLDLLVLHHGTQFPVDEPEDLSAEQWDRTLRINLSSFFHLSRAALQFLGEGSSIVMTGSVNGFRGNGGMVDYAVSKGGIHTLVHSLSQALMDRGIRVNGVAPGPVWTPLIPATFGPEKVAEFGRQAPMERAAQPDEIAPSYIFLASGQLSSYYSGEILAATGGEIHPG